MNKKKVYENKENEVYLSIHILYQSIFSLFVCDEVIQMLLFVLKNELLYPQKNTHHHRFLSEDSVHARIHDSQ